VVPGAGPNVLSLVLLLLTTAAQAGPLTLHPLGRPLPSPQQGPFITTADGGVLCIDARQAHHSTDEGKTWRSTPLFQQPDRYQVSNERVLFRTREGTVISAWMNLREKSFAKGFRWGGPPEEYAQWILPTYVCRSLDDGKTWETPILLHKPWCGCIHSITQLKSGRIVLVGQTIIPEWRHATLTYVSDDQGQTWQRSNILDYGQGRHDHAGSCEATILERADGTLYMLLRTESGYFYEATSTDRGLTWGNLRKSNVPSVTCCGQIARLADGRVVLLWNHPPRNQPGNRSSREELSLAFSTDEGKSWTERTVIAARYRRGGEPTSDSWVAYPYLYERRPGELWVTTMQGGLRMQIRTADITAEAVPLPPSIVFAGDSTTAFRPGAVRQVTSDRIAAALHKAGSPLTILNRGVGGHTTNDGLAKLKAEIPNLNAQLVVIQFGINDSAIDVWRNPPATAPRVALDRFRTNLRQMVTLAQSNGAAVILMTTNPLRWTPKLRSLYGKPPYDLNSDEGFDRPALAGYNDTVRKLAAELHVPLVDIHKAYQAQAKQQETTVDSLLLDGMHPNDAGHAVTARQLLPVLLELLESSAAAKTP
jgi:lysophospholipase L1-like esterase